MAGSLYCVPLRAVSYTHLNLRQSVENYCDMTAIASEKEKIKNKLLKTKKTFYLEGWIPERLSAKAEKLLDGMNCCYRFAEAEEGDEVPVLLDNKNFFVPFEAITEMYSLPDYRGFDPTSIFAMFYAVFFGMKMCIRDRRESSFRERPFFYRHNRPWTRPSDLRNQDGKTP